MSGGKFSMDDYVDVAERISIFISVYPQGSLQSEVLFVDGGVLCKAYAYRTSDDERPGIGHAFEPIPGKTPYTRDSEMMNAETSAWGRAIVALGFETKKIASADEVRARQDAPEPSVSVQDRAAEVAEGTSADSTASASGANPAEQAQAAQTAAREARTPDDGGVPGQVVITFGKKALGKRINEAPRDYLQWIVDKFEPRGPEHRRIQMAAGAFLRGDKSADWEIPF